MNDLLRLAKDLGLPLVATNDLHYTHADDAKAHAALLCVQSGSTLTTPTASSSTPTSSTSSRPREMRQLFRELPEACDNTLLIAERCEVAFTEGDPTCRASRCPEGETETSWFVKEVERGLHGALSRRHPRRGRASRPSTRSASSSQMGFPGYFLVVADFINWAKDNGIRVGPGRGSGAGSMAAYAMRHHRPRPARSTA